MAKRIAVFLMFATLLVACSSKKGAYNSYDKSAVASYYADKFNGRKTASGEKFSNSKLTAAHKKLPFGTKVKVTNKANGKSVVVVVNDRGPFGGGRDIDLSKKAFMQITDNKNHGELKVTIEVSK
ncbi:septal ring lytic transglycosylase RlpA family protein [Flavobacterium sp. Sd200]|uniref:septal ring lytic transglycosylase RlpA family protein n=1 Tax=Flavobacterium sp. Sd200 TaxID=2692211 RepID=UPI00136B6AD4|nr:septal ring lytic transglycosylase RlpA family protein [Flavobacterium sp. Sd200]MXN92547.1 septal ring lytic transglycosylase RlpA family protein [Flavobacterium sp. Sd200]